jgi:hypothetical protein|nr:MAG TPA: repressor protein CI [Caudoviricetes sp.]
MNDVTRRFIETYKEMGLTGYRMGKDCSSITKQKISNIENNLTEASIDMVSNFCEIYSNVNANYILTGKGSMFLNNDELSSSTDVGTFGLTYDELARLYETTVSRYERLIENMKMKFETLEHAFVDVKETFDRESA